MFIQTETTPNPATLKFLPGETVLAAGTADFPNREAAAASPLAARIFALGSVSGVFLGSDFVTVTKTDGAIWDQIKPSILGAIMDHYQSGQPAVSETGAPAAGRRARIMSRGPLVEAAPGAVALRRPWPCPPHPPSGAS